MTYAALIGECPQGAGYSFKRDIGLVKTPFDSPFQRQGAYWKGDIKTFTVSVRVPQSKLDDVKTFFLTEAYSPFEMTLVSGDGSGPTTHTVRAISPYSAVPVQGRDTWAISFTVETILATDPDDLTPSGYPTTEETCCNINDAACCDNACDTGDPDVYAFQTAYLESEAVAGGVPGVSDRVRWPEAAYLASIGKFAVLQRTTFSGPASTFQVGLSADGLVWDWYLPFSNANTGKIFAAGSWLIGMGAGGGIVYILASQNGMSWSETSVALGGSIENAFFDGTYYWLVGYDSAGDCLAYRSTDPSGGSWTQIRQTSMSFSGGTVTPSGTTTNDTMDWEYSAALGKHFLLIASNAGTYVENPIGPPGAYLPPSELYTSTDGINWTYVPTSSFEGSRSICRARVLATPSRVLIFPCRTGVGAVGDAEARVYSSTDGASWSHVGEMPQNDAEQISNGYLNVDMFERPVYHASRGWVAVFSNANYQIGYFVLTRDSGATWTKIKNAHYPSDPEVLQPSYGGAVQPTSDGWLFVTPANSAGDAMEPGILWSPDCG